MLSNLDSLLAHKELDKVVTKPFLEVHKNFEHLYDVEAVKSEPLKQDDKHLAFGQIKAFETDEDNLSTFKTSFFAHFWQMSSHQTQLLLDKCKEHNSTVQGVLSVAKMICLLNETCKPCENEPFHVEVLNSIPCDMRYYFGLQSDDLIKGTLNAQARTIFVL